MRVLIALTLLTGCAATQPQFGALLPTYQAMVDVKERQPIVYGVGNPTFSDAIQAIEPCNLPFTSKFDNGWSTPNETKERGTANCADAAICKLYALREIGVLDAWIYNTTDHAFLVANVAGEQLVFDVDGLRYDLRYNVTGRFNEHFSQDVR